MGYEALVVHTALVAWVHLLRGRRVFRVDNTSAQGVFVKGVSRTPDMNVLAGWFWQRCALAGIIPRICRVSSASNIADGPSRQRWGLLGAFTKEVVAPAPEVSYRFPRAILEALVWGAI